MHTTPLGIRVPDNTDNTELWTHFDNMADDIDALIALRALASKVVAIRKTTGEIVSNSVAPQNDDQLLFNAAANSAYIIQACLLVSVTGNSSGSDIKVGFGLPAGASCSFMGPGADVAIGAGLVSGSANFGSVVGGFSSTLTFGLGGVGTMGILINGTIVTAATGGNCAIAWAQNTATAVNTSVLAGSFLLATKV